MTQNPLAQTPEWKALAEQYKTNMETYQPGPQWYYGHLETGKNFDGTDMTMEQLQRLVRKSGPVGPEIDVDLVVDVTPTWDMLVDMFPEDRGTFTGFNYEQYYAWVQEQNDAFYYGRDKEDFSKWEAYSIAAKLGYHKVIMENFS